MDSVFKSSHQGQPSLLVSLDMRATSDTIVHSTLPGVVWGVWQCQFSFFYFLLLCCERTGVTL